MNKVHRAEYINVTSCEVISEEERVLISEIALEINTSIIQKFKSGDSFEFEVNDSISLFNGLTTKVFNINKMFKIKTNNFHTMDLCKEKSLVFLSIKPFKA